MHLLADIMVLNLWLAERDQQETRSLADLAPNRAYLHTQEAGYIDESSCLLSPYKVSKALQGVDQP